MADVNVFCTVCYIKANINTRRPATKNNQMFSLKDFRMPIIMTMHHKPRKRLLARNYWQTRNSKMSGERMFKFKNKCFLMLLLIFVFWQKGPKEFYDLNTLEVNK